MPGNSLPRRGSPVTPKGSSSPKAVTDLRRAVSDKRASKDPAETKQRSSTLDSKRSSNSSLNESAESLNRQTPSPPVKKPPRIPTGKPSPQTENKSKSDSLPRRTGSNELEGKKPVLPPKPALPAKPPKPPMKPQRNLTTPGEKPNTLPKKTLASIVNGLPTENVNNAETRTTAEVTSGKNVTLKQERVPPARPSPATRVSRHKPTGTKLLEMIEQKLDEEEIDLAQEPYSKQVVFCDNKLQYVGSVGSG